VSDLLGTLVLVGVPGLVVGTLLGRVARSWMAVVLFLVLGGVALLTGFELGPEGDPDEDDDPIVVVYLAMLTNAVTYAVGLVLGRVARR
jgi:putative Mn2+ efflux pump MntP